ncbi:MAG TPA: hypothetical protein VKR55_10285 [Bradyrhizobium sp.]|uniref:hypothetical protein n=1 Tax=Bradyrhizobium sp. TaxID=376 RepID=UPI002C158C8D|nr:hypothetical protein [Bradyrhizobium sp.]HLZ02522.1 hypothetical protein [Bradyrhizobium sp.]
MISKMRERDQADLSTRFVFNRHDSSSTAMIRGLGNALIIVAIASLLDQYFYAGRYTDAAFAMLRQIRHSFGL